MISTIIGDLWYGFFAFFIIIAMGKTAKSIKNVMSLLAGTTVSAYPTFFGIFAVILCVASIVLPIILRVFASRSTHR